MWHGSTHRYFCELCVTTLQEKLPMRKLTQNSVGQCCPGRLGLDSGLLEDSGSDNGADTQSCSVGIRGEREEELFVYGCAVAWCHLSVLRDSHQPVSHPVCRQGCRGVRLCIERIKENLLTEIRAVYVQHGCLTTNTEDPVAVCPTRLGVSAVVPTWFRSWEDS